VSSWLRVLRRPALRRTLTVSLLVQFGYWFSTVAFQWLVAKQTDNDPLALSLLYFCAQVPMLLFGLPAGLLADVRDRRSVIFGAQAGVVLVGAVAAALVVTGVATPAVVMACGFVAGMAQAFSVPATQALVADSVPPQDVRTGVLLQAAGLNVARVVGPAVAGGLLLAFGSAQALATYGGTGLGAVVLIWGLRRMSFTLPARAGKGLLQGIRGGLRHTRDRSPAVPALLLVAGMSMFGMSYQAQLPAVAARLSPDDAVYVMLVVVSGVGSAIGVAFAALWRDPRPSVTMPAIVLTVQGLFVAALGLSRSVWLTGVIILLAGALQFAVMTACNAVLMAVIDDSQRGRVASLYLMCWGGLLPVGGLLLGAVWNGASAPVALAVSGLLAILVAGYVLRPGAVRHGAPA
jgi:MFS family permease